METFVPPSWDRFRDWIHCVAVVTFDLELGQTLEVKTFLLLTLLMTFTITINITNDFNDI